MNHQYNPTIHHRRSIRLQGYNYAQAGAYFVTICSQQRAHFAEELQSLVIELGGKPEDAGSVTGAIFRGWMDFKSVLTGKDEGAVLNEVERGEDHAKDAYLKALEKNLPATIHSVINNQFGAMKEAHDHIKLMRDADNKFAQKTSSR